MATIILHTPDKNNLTFSPLASIGLHDVPKVILPFLKQDVYQLTNDLLLQHGVNAREHFFVVDTSATALGEDMKFHVMVVLSSAVKDCTFQEVFSKAIDTYGHILGQKSYASVKFSATNGSEVTDNVLSNTGLQTVRGLIESTN